MGALTREIAKRSRSLRESYPANPWSEVSFSMAVADVRNNVIGKQPLTIEQSACGGAE